MYTLRPLFYVPTYLKMKFHGLKIGKETPNVWIKSLGAGEELSGNLKQKRARNLDNLFKKYADKCNMLSMSQITIQISLHWYT